MRIILPIVMICISILIPAAYGHGLGMEEVGPKNIGDKLIIMHVELEPESKRADMLEDITFHLKFMEMINKTKVSIPGIAANIEISRFRDNQLLLNETFHIMSDVDELAILFRTTESGDIKIDGRKMGSFGYMRSPNNEMVIVEGPIFVMAGLYKIKVTPLALYSKSLPEEHRIPFTSLLTLSEIKDHEIIYKGQSYTIETIAYYDSIREVVFDEDNLTLKAEMPFDWSLVNEISMLHFEYYLPKGFELADRELTGYINGVKQEIFVDRADKNWGAVVHFMIGQKRLKELALNMQGDHLNKAILEIRGGRLIQQELPTEWSPAISTKSNKGSIIVDVEWSPITIDDKQDTFFKLTFRDATTNNVLEDITYDMVLLDKDGNVINHRSSQTDNIQIYRFSEAGEYTLMLQNINNTGEDVMVSLNVIPEFPIAMMIITLSIASVIIMRLFNKPKQLLRN